MIRERLTGKYIKLDFSENLALSLFEYIKLDFSENLALSLFEVQDA